MNLGSAISNSIGCCAAGSTSKARAIVGILLFVRIHAIGGMQIQRGAQAVLDAATR